MEALLSTAMADMAETDSEVVAAAVAVVPDLMESQEKQDTVAMAAMAMSSSSQYKEN